MPWYLVTTNSKHYGLVEQIWYEDKKILAPLSHFLAKMEKKNGSGYLISIGWALISNDDPRVHARKSFVVELTVSCNVLIDRQWVPLKGKAMFMPRSPYPDDFMDDAREHFAQRAEKKFGVGYVNYLTVYSEFDPEKWKHPF